MKEKLLKIVELAKNLLSRLARILGVLDGDGKVDEEKVRVATEWAKEKTIATANEVSRLGKEAMKSDMVKDAAAGAVVGAAIAVPVPVIGPLAGWYHWCGTWSLQKYCQKRDRTIQASARATY